jgi:DNA-binding response OmpR family regulator
MDQQAKLTGLKVLVVEDDHLVREVIARAATALGAEVDVAAEGAAALLRLAERRYDIVVTDLRMPKFSGLDVLRAARERLGAVGLVVITGLTDQSDELAIEQLGATLVRKPFRSRELAEALRRSIRPQELPADD